MTRPVLTDELIRNALSPHPTATAPAGLLAAIALDVASTPQARPGLHRLHRPSSHRLAWIAVAAAAMLALLGALILGGGSRPSLQSDLRPPSPLPAGLAVQRGPWFIQLLGVSAEQAWVAEPKPDPSTDYLGIPQSSFDPVQASLLRHRTAAGWGGPVEVGPIGLVHALARMPDDRVAIAAEGGVWVGDERGWDRVSPVEAWDVAADAAGTIWAIHPWGDDGPTVAVYRRETGTWVTERIDCPAAETTVAIAADGTAWIGSTYWMAGLAHATGDTCVEVLPIGDGIERYVPSIATDGGGMVAVLLMDPGAGDAGSPGGRIMAWDGARWETLRHGAELAPANGGSWRRALEYAPDGTLWAAFQGRLWRYASGTWGSIRPVYEGSPISVAPDGTVWYLGQEANEPGTPNGGLPVERVRPQDVDEGGG